MKCKVNVLQTMRQPMMPCVWSTATSWRVGPWWCNLGRKLQTWPRLMHKMDRVARGLVTSHSGCGVMYIVFIY